MALTIDDLAEGLSARADDTLYATGTPGGLVALADKSGRIIERAYGLSDATVDPPVKMSTTHVAHVGSQAKIHIAVVVMRLVEQGLIDLDAPVDHYLPFHVHNPVGGRPTIRQLLTHTSGLVTDTFEALWTTPADEEDYYDTELEMGLAREYGRHRYRWGTPAGEEYVYSTFGLGIAAVAVEEVMEKPWMECVKEMILEPLGMSGTAWPGGPDWTRLEGHHAGGHLRIGDMWYESPAIRSGAPHSCEMVTRPGDQLRLLVALWRGGEAYGKRILQRESVEALLSPQVRNVLFGLDLGWMGLSVQIRNFDSPDFVFGHGGGYPLRGWAESRVYPRLGFAVAATINAWRGERHINPPDLIPAGIWSEWAARWMAAGEMPPQRPSIRESWSFAAGILTGERFVGSLGLDGIPLAVIDRMATTAHPMTGTAREEWDADAFRAGIRAMERTGGRPDEIRALLASPDCPVGQEEMELFGLMWGLNRATNPMLLRVLSDRSSEPARYRHLREMRTEAFGQGLSE